MDQEFRPLIKGIMIDKELFARRDKVENLGKFVSQLKEALRLVDDQIGAMEEVETDLEDRVAYIESRQPGAKRRAQAKSPDKDPAVKRREKQADSSENGTPAAQPAGAARSSKRLSSTIASKEAEKEDASGHGAEPGGS